MESALPMKLITGLEQMKGCGLVCTKSARAGQGGSIL